MEDVARRAAARYKSRCWWAEFDDLHQQALEAALRAERTFDPDVGVPLDAYLWRACVLALRTYTWKQSPVSAPDHKLTELRGLHRAELTDVTDDRAQEPWADKVLSDKQWADRARASIEEALGEQSDKALALRVLLADEKPREVADACDVPIQRVYRATQRARDALGRDLDIYHLWKELWK